MMYYNALTATAQDMGAAFSPERLALAGQMTLIGMGMIFAVLAILWGVLVVFKLVFTKPTKKSEEKIATAPAQTQKEAEQTDDQELIAVITAAVAAYMDSENPEGALNRFRVVSFRRANGGRSWNVK